MNDPTPGFEQLFTSKLFVMPRQAGDVGWCAYLLGRSDTPPAPGTPVSIAQSFNDYNGHYLFALKAPALPDEAAVETFIAAVRAYLDNCYGPGFGQQFNGQACMWMPDPANLSTTCGAYDFSFGASGYSGVYLQSTLNNPVGKQITFVAQSGLSLSPSQTGLVLTGVGGSNLSFQTLQIDYGPNITPNTAQIPFFGQYSGCFIFAGTIDPAVTLSHFDTGFQYAHGNANAADSVQTYALLDTGQPGSLFNYAAALDPLDAVNQSAATVDLANGKLRTLFAPVAPQGGAPPQFASWLRPTTNKALSLVPVGGGDNTTGAPVPFAGAFVFEYARPKSSSAGLRPVYMTPAGDFALAVAGAPLSGTGAGATYELLCGLFGSETINFRAYATDTAFDRLRFTPHQPAYAPVFPFPQATLDDPASGAVGERLTGVYSTSWAWLVSGDTAAAYYHAQPEGSPLYQSDGAGDGGVNVLSTYQPLTKLVYAGGRAVPFAPYACFAAAPPAGFTVANLSDFESQIISPTRKKIIASSVETQLTALKAARLARLAALHAETGDAAAALDAALDDVTKTTTPQGLLAEVTTGDTGADYVRVTLAQTDPPAGFSSQMAFNHLQTPLQNLFQTNQLFGVVVNPKNLGQLLNGPPPSDPTQPSFENTATITGWTFTAEVGEGVSATDYRNVLIFKFAEGTVEERVRNPNKWAATADFSLPDNAGDPGFALTGLSNWLQTFIAAGIAEADKGNTLYQNFKQIVTNPNWNGILVLRADVNASGIPDQIKGLAAGINFSQFEAHHFGVNVSRVSVSGTSIQIAGLSTMFGLIDYQLPLFRQNVAVGGNPDFPLAVPVAGDYAFTVLQLQALFQNSALVDFRSRVQLNLARLFGSVVTQNYGSYGRGTTNAVVLRGSYQSQGTTSTYVFEQDSPTTFVVASNILNAVSFSRVQFNTLTANSGGANPLIRSRFLFWGAFDFAVLLDANGNPFDTLSFGSPPKTPPASLGAGLAFSNLQINMESPVATPGAVAFTFESAGLAFDLAASTVRENSLFAGFALQLDSFITTGGDKRPPDFGYLSVGADIPLTALSGAWFGVVYKVTMGTPGALVSKAGFESRLLLAWSAQTGASDKNYSVFTGLQLPGAAPGAKLLSIQGVLKVAVDSIQLLYETVAGSSAKGFSLRLSNIGLKLFGIAKLPPGASINFFLFGAPGGKGSLGWYAAYIEDSNQKANAPQAVAPPEGQESLKPTSDTLALPEATTTTHTAAANQIAHAPEAQENA